MAFVNFPVSFEEEESRVELDNLVSTSVNWSGVEKVRTLGEAIHGKVLLQHGVLPGCGPEPFSFAVKKMKRTTVLTAKGIDCPRNELRAALALRDLGLPHVAKVLGVFGDEKFYYLCTEYCEHGELFGVLQRVGRLQGEEVLREVIWQVLTSLAALHAAGIAHRDVSLENVLAASDGTLRLIDFAEAMRVRSPGHNSGLEAAVCEPEADLPGKPNYRGPEVSRGRQYLATKVDVFACGVMLYTLATGGYPFETAQGDDLYPEAEACSERCSRLGAKIAGLGLGSNISPLLLDLLEQLMAPNPYKRISAEDALSHPWISLGGLRAPPSEESTEDPGSDWEEEDGQATFYDEDVDM